MDSSTQIVLDGEKEICSVVVEVCDKVIHQLPPMLLITFNLCLFGRLLAPPHTSAKMIVESMLRQHSGETKVQVNISSVPQRNFTDLP
jgi:hypothetical protein